MSENDNRSYRDSTAGRTPDRPRAQADDPLAELATLLSQSVLKNRAGQDRGATARETYVAPDEVLEPSGVQYSASDESRYDRDFEQLYDTDTKDRCDPSVRADVPPSGRSSRFDLEPDFSSAAATTTAHERHDFVGDDSNEAAYRERAEASSDLRESRYGDEYEEYSEDLDTRRQSGLIFVAVIFGLAVLGTAGAFAYRAMFGGPPPIINAEGGPNKIIPGDANPSANSSRQADANTGSAAPREEHPVEMPPPVDPAPRPVSTVPIFPDLPPAGGPGAVVGFPALGPSSNLASSQPSATVRAESPSAPPVVTLGANPAPSAASPSVPLTTASGPPPTPTVPGAPGQLNAADPAPGSAPSPATPAHTATQTQGSKQGANDANGPLSIVPSSPESSAATTRPRIVPAQPVPLNKPPANETASVTPASPAGGYVVQVSSHRSEKEAQSSFRDLQAKYPDLLGGRTPTIRRADLGAKGTYYRAMVGPFASSDQATKLCSNLKAAGGSCLVQKN